VGGREREHEDVAAKRETRHASEVDHQRTGFGVYYWAGRSY
jgi:hypothetical protein